jgi:hypothetical protein
MGSTTIARAGHTAKYVGQLEEQTLAVEICDNDYDHTKGLEERYRKLQWAMYRPARSQHTRAPHQKIRGLLLGTYLFSIHHSDLTNESTNIDKKVEILRVVSVAT